MRVEPGPGARIACHRVPDLPLVAELRAHPELAGRPLAIASGAGPRAELVAVSPEAARAGVRPLISIAHARAVCGPLCVRLASPALEKAARAALLDAALSLSPRAALAPLATGAYAGEAAVYLDASGVASLFRSEGGFATALADGAQRLGLPGIVAVASSRWVAHIAARSLNSPDDGPCILPPGAESEFLAPLPIDLFDPGDHLAQALTRFGVHHVRDLLALPRRALGSRLGPDVLRLIARVRGEEPELPLPVPEETRIVEASDLEFCIDRLEPLTFALQGLLSRLLERLEARRLACEDLVVTLGLEGGGRDVRHVGVAAPTGDLRVLVRLLRHALETRPPEASVQSLCLETEGSRLQRDQLDLFRPAGPAPAALGQTLAELASLCGDQRVGTPRVADSHHPAAFGMAPFHARRGKRSPPVEPREPLSAHLALRALRPPVSAAVTLFQGRPERVRSAAANGRVIRLAGPWRSTGGWWSREEHYAYDSFDVQTSDGTVARLRFDHLRRQWHVDAIYD